MSKPREWTARYDMQLERFVLDKYNGQEFAPGHKTQEENLTGIRVVEASALEAALAEIERLQNEYETAEMNKSLLAKAVDELRAQLAEKDGQSAVTGAHVLAVHASSPEEVLKYWTNIMKERDELYAKVELLQSKLSVTEQGMDELTELGNKLEEENAWLKAELERANARNSELCKIVESKYDEMTRDIEKEWNAKQSMLVLHEQEKSRKLKEIAESYKAICAKLLDALWPLSEGIIIDSSHYAVAKHIADEARATLKQGEEK